SILPSQDTQSPVTSGRICSPSHSTPNHLRSIGKLCALWMTEKVDDQGYFVLDKHIRGHRPAGRQLRCRDRISLARNCPSTSYHPNPAMNSMCRGTEVARFAPGRRGSNHGPVYGMGRALRGPGKGTAVRERIGRMFV